MRDVSDKIFSVCCRILKDDHCSTKKMLKLKIKRLLEIIPPCLHYWLSLHFLQLLSFTNFLLTNPCERSVD